MPTLHHEGIASCSSRLLLFLLQLVSFVYGADEDESGSEIDPLLDEEDDELEKLLELEEKSLLLGISGGISLLELDILPELELLDDMLDEEDDELEKLLELDELEDE